MAFSESYDVAFAFRILTNLGHGKFMTHLFYDSKIPKNMTKRGFLSSCVMNNPICKANLSPHCVRILSLDAAEIGIKSDCRIHNETAEFVNHERAVVREDAATLARASRNVMNVFVS